MYEFIRDKDRQTVYFVPDDLPLEEAISRTTHMGISAHQDDIEIMAAHGIIECFRRDDKWFFAVVVTDGAGSPREGLYKFYTDEEMKKVREKEQKKAAYAGEYGALALMNYSSMAVKNPNDEEIVQKLASLISEAGPDIIYTHNPADKHDTHVAVAIKVIKAVRMLQKEERPKKLYGCEVWRSLDWVNDDEKVLLDVSVHPNISAALLALHDSQISGGKRYDMAVVGRRTANATFANYKATDTAAALTYAMDLTPLIEDDKLDIREYTAGFIDRFKRDVLNRINNLL